MEDDDALDDADVDADFDEIPGAGLGPVTGAGACDDDVADGEAPDGLLCADAGAGVCVCAVCG